MKRTAMTVLVAGILVALNGMAYGVAKPGDRIPDLPEIWKTVGPQERLKSLRVAELDGTRLLAERVYGVRLNADTTIHDLALRSDQIAAAVRDVIKGVSTTEDEEYLDDGTVQVTRAVKLSQVLETIERTIKQQQTEQGPVTLEDVGKVERENRDTVLEVMGNGALPNSLGLKKIQAKRAAEMDAYRKLAERLLGMEVTASSTVKDFVLESDEILGRVSALVKGARPVKIAYSLTDNSCEVTMQLKVAEVFEVIRKYSKSAQNQQEQLLKMEREHQEQTFSETGHGAPRPEGHERRVQKLNEPKVSDGVYSEINIIVKRLLGRDVVLE
jgi:hypothetical protein